MTDITNDDFPEPPDPKVFLIANGFMGIVCPGECGCTLDDLMPCGVDSFSCDGWNGIPKGCEPGHKHIDPKNPGHWIVSTKREPPSDEAFDMWRHLQ